MNLSSALFKQILDKEDFDTWSSLRKNYLPSEYHNIYDIIEKYSEHYHKLPTIEELKLSTRDGPSLDKIYAIEAVEVEAEPFLLLDYLKNEFTQKQTLHYLHQYVENSISFETAEETVQSLYDIVTKIEDQVDLQSSDENMQKIELFDSEDEIASYLPLGLNTEFDARVRFRSIDYIMMGGKRGSGKSLTCCNLADNLHRQGKSTLFFTVEMQPRELLQRLCAIGSGVDHHKIKYKTLDNLEWLRVATWWANRFENGEVHLDTYKRERNFEAFHKILVKEKLKPNQIDIIYDPGLSISKIRAEVLKRTKKLDNVGAIIVDYINVVKGSHSDDLFDWKEQINVSKGLKKLAQDFEIPVFSPYQVDAQGEARFAKGILDSCDAAFVLEAGPESIQFTCTKIRGDAKIDFTSKVDWSTLRIGPENGSALKDDKHEKEPTTRKKGFGTNAEPDTKPIMDSIYD